MTSLTALQVATGRAPAGYSRTLAVTDQTRGLGIFWSPDHQVLVVGFSGTRGRPWPPSRDWLSNLRAWPKTLTPGSSKYTAHAGFVEEYMSLRDHILKAVYVCRPSKIVVTGFSQGAAHATLCWRDLVALYPGTAIEGFAFASPRVYTDRASLEFDHELANGPVNHTFERFNLWGDPIPQLPPWFLGYRHCGPVTNLGRFTLFPDPDSHNPKVYMRVFQE